MQYADFVTPYAFHLIATQILLSKKIDGKVESSEGTLYVNQQFCQCSFWKMLQLPCRHVLALRQTQHLCIFDKGLVTKWWTLDYTVTSHQDYEHPSSPGKTIHKPCPSEVVEKKLSAHQKYRKVLKVCEEIAGFASEVGMDEFKRRLNTLNKIKQNWIGDTAVGKSVCCCA